jgi:ankyrin repeat protein
MLGANVSAQNRRGATPLHHAASGNPNALNWNPPAQAKTIAALIALGADPDAPDKNGTTPLHRAIRTRCSVAVGELLNAGTDMARPTRNGSSPLTLAKLATGRTGRNHPPAGPARPAGLKVDRS